MEPKVVELASLIVVSNDHSSKEIKISKNTKFEDFKKKILNKFNLPEDFNIKLFYFEAYSHDLFFISKDEEYVTANRKSIEYFYLCSPNEDYSQNNDEIKYYNYLKYYSVIIFSPIKILNSENQNNQRKKMKLIINNNHQNNKNKNESDSSNTNNNSENEMKINNMANSMMLDNNIKNSMIQNSVLMQNPMILNNMGNTMICNDNILNNMNKTMMNNNMNNTMMMNNNMNNTMMNNNMNNTMMNNNMNNTMMMNNNMNKTMMMNNNMNNTMMLNNMNNTMLNNMNNRMMVNNMNNNMIYNNMNNNMMYNNMNNNMMYNNMNNNIMYNNNMFNNMNNNMMYNNMMCNNMVNNMNNRMMYNNMSNNMMYNNMMNNMNNNFMFNNPMFNNCMRNNMMNQNMYFNQMNNNMMNPNMVENMINQMIEIYEKNPMMGLTMMKNMNPAILNQMNKIIEERNKEKEDNNLDKNIEAELPEFETIDIESNPLNRYIENAINISYVMKLESEKQKSAHPELFVNISEVLSSPGLLSNQEPSDADYKYLLCLIGKILENNQITVGIYKENNIKDRVELSAIQFIFSGLINKKKYKLKFCDEINENYFICLRHDLSFRKSFIEERKKIIANLLNIDKKFIILTNPRKEGNLYIDLAFNPDVGDLKENEIKQKLIKNEIVDCEIVPLLEGCRLSPNIFDQNFHKFYNPDANLTNLKRGGEEYIQPLSWTAYGINVSGKYDFGSDMWLGNSNGEKEFAVAYYGINLIFNQNLIMLQNLVNFKKNYESGKTYIGAKNVRKPGQKIKAGAYFYKNPIIAENSSESINVGGFEYKIMFMCRVKSSEIRQPENFQDCWILSLTSDEVRPYKILIKKIPKSALAVASQQEIKCFSGPKDSYIQIIQNKDESFYKKNKSGLNNNDFILKIYTDSSFINNYLRDNKKSKYKEKYLKSYVWCLHKAITENNQNVDNNTLVYRGVNVKIPNSIGVGSKFYFSEFLSTSKDINVAKNFAGNGTIIYITILNNGINGKKIYCRDVESISTYPLEKEIIITSYCYYRVTKIERSPQLDKLYLTCEGYNF